MSKTDPKTPCDQLTAGYWAGKVSTWHSTDPQTVTHYDATWEPGSASLASAILSLYNSDQGAIDTDTYRVGVSACNSNGFTGSASDAAVGPMMQLTGLFLNASHLQINGTESFYGNNLLLFANLMLNATPAPDDSFSTAYIALIIVGGVLTIAGICAASMACRHSRMPRLSENRRAIVTTYGATNQNQGNTHGNH
jgi:hypothetical protein